MGMNIYWHHILNILYVVLFIINVFLSFYFYFFKIIFFNCQNINTIYFWQNYQKPSNNYNKKYSYELKIKWFRQPLYKFYIKILKIKDILTYLNLLINFFKEYLFINL